MRIINLETHKVIKFRITDCCNYRCPYCIRREFINNNQYNLELDEVLRIANEMKGDKPIKIDLIGGEVTVIPNLKEIIDKLLTVADKINITTNASKDLSYLADKRITLTCSYHPTETDESVKDWIDRIVSYKDLFGYVKIETVNRKGATHIQEFIEYAKQKNIDYMVEANLLEPDTKSTSSIKKNYRYKYIDGDKEEYFYTRNSFLKKYGKDSCVIPTNGLKCSNGFDYVYIEGDRVITCKGTVPIKLYHPETSWHPCYRPNSFCTLCGNISVCS